MWLGWAGLAGLVHAEVVTLHYEQAPAPSGPWTQVDPARVQVLPDGTAAIDSQARQAYFRLRILPSGDGGTLPLLPLAEVPASSLEVARRHIAASQRAADPTDEDDDTADWADVQFAPFACPLFKPGDGSVQPGYVELKLVAPRPSPRAGEGFLPHLSDQPDSCDRGFIIVSTSRDDLPALEFNSSGPTPVERLLRRCGGKTPARVVRFGPTFWAAEDAAGNLIGNLGTEPFKIPHEFAAVMERRFSGEIQTERDLLELPPDLKLKLAGYANYAELKRDYEASPVHRLLRERRAAYAGFHWDLEEGRMPTILELRAGETNVFLAGTVVTDVVVHWEGIRNLADISLLRSGIRVVGRQVGSAPMTVQTSRGLQYYVLRVRSTAAGSAGLAGAATPFWRTKTWWAGDWNDQMHYYQLRDSDWCDLVGCGPTALAMLFGYWDRRGVPSAFYTGLAGTAGFDSLRLSDAPQEINTAARKATLRKVYHPLHDLCDVICPPFTDAGATWPGDLIEGFAGYLHPVANNLGLASVIYGKGNRLVNYSCSWAWDSWGDDWEVSGVRVANGIKSGRPGVVGLGVLWHYGVAYAYRRKEFVLPVGNEEVVLQLKRYFRVNEGWASFSPSWYSAYDVFLGLTANLSQARTPQLP